MSGCADKQQELTVDELISLGERFLLELNYEQALIQFNKVIEIEPMNVRGYTGAAEAYIGLEQLDEAVAILQKGLEHTEDVEIQNMLDVLTLNDIGNSNELTSEQNELIQQLAKVLIEEDFTSAAIITKSDIYQQLVEKALEVGSIIHHGQDTNLIIFPNGFIYCGELDNNLRSGLGIWFNGLAGEGHIYYYKGQWMNDLPNGEGAIYEVIDVNDIEKEEGSTLALYIEEVGTFRDGCYDGIFSTTWHMDDGEVHYWTPTYDSGIAQIIPDAAIDEDGYDIAICVNCGANLVSSGSYLYCVLGFDNAVITYNAGDFLGYTAQKVIDIFGDNYVTDNDGGSSFFYYEGFEVPMIFFVGEYISGNKITGKETIKYIAITDGEIISGIKIGDTAEHIAEVLNVEYSEPQQSDFTSIMGSGYYENSYNVIINGVESTMYFQFNQPDGGCVGTQVKGNSLY